MTFPLLSNTELQLKTGMLIIHSSLCNLDIATKVLSKSKAQVGKMSQALNSTKIVAGCVA